MLSSLSLDLGKIIRALVMSQGTFIITPLALKNEGLGE
jgi:hypothetical protein